MTQKPCLGGGSSVVKPPPSRLMHFFGLASAAGAGGEGGASPSGGGGWRRGQARPRLLGRDPSEEPQSLADRLPEWMGYGALYAISAIPVLIAGSVIAILFFNSLK